MIDSGPKIKNLEIREIAKDPDNFIAEASLDSVGDRVVMVYGRYRGMKHTDDGSIMFVASEDGGRTWDTGATSVALEQYEDWGFTSPGVKILDDGSIFVVAHTNDCVGYSSSRNRGFRGAYSTCSVDGGKTWGRPEQIVAWPFRHLNIWDNPEVAEDGSLLLAVSGTVDNARIQGSYAECSRSGLLRSDDKGRHWYCHGTIAFDTGGIHNFYEPAVARTGSGDLVSLSRQHYELSGSSPPGGYLFEAHSSDGGASWSAFRKSALWGYPADLICLADGRVLSAYGHRKDPASVKVALSDDGITWSEEDAWEIYRPPVLTEGSDEAAGMLNTGFRHIGYPSAVQTASGEVLVAFHSFSEKERKQILLLASFEV